MEANAAAGTVVRRRQFYQLPDLFARGGVADQGDGGRAFGEVTGFSGNLRVVNENVPMPSTMTNNAKWPKHFKQGTT